MFRKVPSLFKLYRSKYLSTTDLSIRSVHNLTHELYGRSRKLGHSLARQHLLGMVLLFDICASKRTDPRHSEWKGHDQNSDILNPLLSFGDLQSAHSLPCTRRASNSGHMPRNAYRVIELVRLSGLGFTTAPKAQLWVCRFSNTIVVI